MKHVVKKSMMVAGVLACLFASTAFAKITPSPEQDKATQAFMEADLLSVAAATERLNK